MSDENPLLDVAERNAAAIEALADELGATLEPLPGDDDGAGKAKFMGFGSGTASSAPDSEADRTAALITRNAENLERVCEAAGVDPDRSSVDAEKAKFLGFGGR